MTDIHTILGEEFDTDQLKDIANYGAATGVHGFTYSSDLHDKYEEYKTQIENELDDLGYTMHLVFAENEFETLQQYKEWACWVYLEMEAHRIIDN